jgi:hypothetical protein
MWLYYLTSLSDMTFLADLFSVSLLKGVDEKAGCVGGCIEVLYTAGIWIVNSINGI